MRLSLILCDEFSITSVPRCVRKIICLDLLYFERPWLLKLLRIIVLEFVSEKYT